jgi:serine/threonine protein kinase
MFHGDVNPSNVLLTGSYDLKLADFGLSGFESAPKQYAGTVGYLSPEVCERRRFSGRRNDLYGAVLTLFKFITGELPFEFADTSDPIFFNVYREKWDKFWSSLRLKIYLSPELRDFFQRCLQFEPKRRLGLEGMRNHPWMIRPLLTHEVVIECMQGLARCS